MIYLLRHSELIVVAWQTYCYDRIIYYYVNPVQSQSISLCMVQEVFLHSMSIHKQSPELYDFYWVV